MEVNSLVPTPVSPQQNPTPSVAEQAAMGKDDFLRLLVTQLQNQDPINPLQAQEFAAQLAQFTSVEQLANINLALEQNAQISQLLSQSMNSGIAAGLIGRTVEAVGNQVMLHDEEPTSIQFELGAPASTVKIVIRNEQGAVVRTIEQTGVSKGKQSIEWDGTTDNGGRLPAGVYTFEVQAEDEAGNIVGVTPLISGKVSRVSFSSDGIYLWIGELSIAMADVRSVSQ